MRAEVGIVELLQAHLERLDKSAQALGFSCLIEEIKTHVEDHLSIIRDGVYRVRLVLDDKGRDQISSKPLSDHPFETATLFPLVVEEAGSPVAVYKTTERSHYQAARRWANDRGADEAILLNPEGQIFDATRSTVWVEKGGMLVTPPLEAGGLPGVMRGHLLKTREDTREEILRPNDLQTAGAVYLSNALRGLMLIQLT